MDAYSETDNWHPKMSNNNKKKFNKYIETCYVLINGINGWN